MKGNFISRKEHDEYAKRMDEENKRQNHRIGVLEDAVKQYGALTIAVEKMACHMQSMLDEQKEQGKRLEALEKQDGDMWRNAVKYVVTAIIGILIGYIFKQFGM